jgi:dTDP-4-dehydrorhamnose reductase
MIYLLGGSGYIGSAFALNLKRRGVAFRSVSRAELDYTNLCVLTTALRRDQPEFLINAAGYTGKPNVDACEFHKWECLAGNAVLPGIVAQACEATNIPWGHVSSGCIYTGSRPDGSGFTEEDAPNFTFRQNNCSFYSGTKALGEEVLSSCPNVYIWRVRIPFDQFDNPRNYLTKVMRYSRLLDATNSISELQEFVEASLLCWEMRVPFGTYNMTNPGAVTTREVVDLIKKNGVCDREFSFFSTEDGFMRTAAIAPRSNCVMNSEKLRLAGIRMTDVREAIERDLRHWTKIGSAEPSSPQLRSSKPNPRTVLRDPQMTQIDADEEKRQTGLVVEALESRAGG